MTQDSVSRVPPMTPMDRFSPGAGAVGVSATDFWSVSVIRRFRSTGATGGVGSAIASGGSSYVRLVRSRR
ncbi:hypothetical protein GCM10010521_10860 [Streptomyces rameus]|uniref:Uncharacterized protein n=1 Tax=Streptomyces rameus TaxID=68261 RepID=A0ABP6MVF6_9ACTN